MKRGDKESYKLLKLEKSAHKALIGHPGFESKRLDLARQIVRSETPNWGSLSLHVR